MSKDAELNSHEILYSAALDPSSIGPTLPSIPPFQLPTGPTGTGSTGPTGPTGSGVSPIFGSLYSDPTSPTLATANTNVDFGVTGPFNGVIPSIVDDSITIDSSGVYTISYTLTMNINTPGFGTTASIFVILTINGSNTQSFILYETELSPTGVGVATTLSRTDQLLLNQGNILRCFITTVSGEIFITSSSLVVTKVQ
ncbi:exosporium leader peptide-containing protein [Bacillus clarus]|uniref:Exosporium leader peptide domain protein n=1 Tax=Bacillus clarus TaxID=2338372 RepID=A0A090YKP2_9BACI|nr:exosporium leader peptide-containing protein [Bacillus clarus]KFM99393.1 exosporium leader peptide domain protein [Bacillus clarus]RFT63267.1 exosporium leader peptide-containing protein [Bacillus clarus]